MRTKITIADIILIVSLLAGSLTWLAVDLLHREPGLMVEIYTADGLYRTAPLAEDRLITVPGALGECTVRISDKAVHMHDSPCPNKICMQMGEIRNAGEVIICAPGRVLVKVRGPDQAVDTLAY